MYRLGIDNWRHGVCGPHPLCWVKGVLNEVSFARLRRQSSDFIDEEAEVSQLEVLYCAVGLNMGCRPLFSICERTDTSRFPKRSDHVGDSPQL